jgi:hypothetical protein
MSKKQKHHQSIIPGHGMGVAVINRDLGYALKTWKRKTKNNNLSEQLIENKEFIKPSVVHRAKMISAAFLQMVKTKREKL